MIQKFRILAMALLIPLGLFQMVVYPTAINIECVGIIWGGCLLVGLLVFRAAPINKAPLSSTMVIGFTISNLAVPLLGVALDGNPITYNLKEPLEAFGYSALAALTLAVTHVVYRNIRTLILGRELITNKIWSPAGLFLPPSTIQLWAIGAVGCAAVCTTAFLFRRNVMDTSGVIQQLIHGFEPFSSAPFLIPIAHYFWPARRPTGGTWVCFGAYFLLIAFLSMALNARSAFIVPAGTLGACLFLALLTGRVKINFFNPRVFIPVLVLFAIVMPTLSDIATAMRIARSQKTVLSSGEMVLKSISLFFDKEQLRNYWKGYSSDVYRAGAWDERYLQNEFLQRFTILKYTDNSLYYTSAFGPVDKQKLIEFSNKRFLALFPAPLLRIFGIYFNKWSVSTMSFGDYLYYARTGFDYASFRTGSFIGVGLAMHGGWFFPIFAIMAIFAFFMMDTFSRSRRHLPSRPGGKADVSRDFAPFILLSLLGCILFFNRDAIVVQVGTFVRDMPQAIILYLVLFYSTRILNVLTPRPPKRTIQPRELAPIRN